MTETTRFEAVTRRFVAPRSRRQALHGLMDAVAAVAGDSVAGAGLTAAKQGGNKKGNETVETRLM